MSERAELNCKLQFNVLFALMVIIFNAIKAAILAYTALSISGNPLITIGGAIASFMDREDVNTKERYLLFLENSISIHPTAMPFSPKHRRWCTAVTGGRWLLWLLLYAPSSHFPSSLANAHGSSSIAVFVVAFFPGTGISQMQGPKDVWSVGFGAVAQQTLLSGTSSASSLAVNAFIANAAQPVFSVLYFSYNGVFTCMAAAHEWSTYGVSRQGLRVSTGVKGTQRSTYFLSLPYSFALPLVLCSAVMDWLISQSIFLVAVEAYDASHTCDPTSDVTTCGYSPMAIIFSFITVLVMCAALIAVGRRRFASAMPVAGSCRMAIAAACHSVPGKRRLEEGDSEKRLM